MAVELAAMTAVRQVIDREAIRDCLARYCRGIDRRDRSLLEGVYWPGAVDDHVNYTGDAEGFIDWVLPLLAGIEHTVHFLGQTLIQLDGDQAGVETYFQAYHRMKVGDELRDEVFGGRYVDRFEKRGEEWRIAYRRVLGDWHRGESSQGSFANFAMGPFPARNVGVAGATDPSVALLAGKWN